jgi:hypothetical protein
MSVEEDQDDEEEEEEVGKMSIEWNDEEEEREVRERSVEQDELENEEEEETIANLYKLVQYAGNIIPRLQTPLSTTLKTALTEPTHQSTSSSSTPSTPQTSHTIETKSVSRGTNKRGSSLSACGLRLGDLNIYSLKRDADWHVSVNLEIPGLCSSECCSQILHTSERSPRPP